MVSQEMTSGQIGRRTSRAILPNPQPSVHKLTRGHRVCPGASACPALEVEFEVRDDHWLDHYKVIPAAHNYTNHNRDTADRVYY